MEVAAWWMKPELHPSAQGSPAERLQYYLNYMHQSNSCVLSEAAGTEAKDRMCQQTAQYVRAHL